MQKAYRTTLLLAYQSFGVVYGDLTISPIYVYKSAFSGKLCLHEEDAEVLGVLSLVFWTITLLALFKYTVIVLGADDNGEGTRRMHIQYVSLSCELSICLVTCLWIDRWHLCFVFIDVSELEDGPSACPTCSSGAR